MTGISSNIYHVGYCVGFLQSIGILSGGIAMFLLPPVSSGQDCGLQATYLSCDVVFAMRFLDSDIVVVYE